MALSKLSGDEPGIVFSQLCNVLDPRVAVYFSITSSELWALTQVQRQQLRADYEVAAALSRKMGMRSCKELREAKEVYCHCTHLSHRGRPCVSRQAGFGAAGAQGPAPPPLLRRRWSRRRAAAG